MDKIAPKKSLGQHFLHDKNIARKITELLEVPDDSVVLEIGSGTGILTELLLEKNITLISSEIDSRSIEILKSKFNEKINKNYFIYEEDFLKLNLKKISEKYSKKIYIIGNIPYYITSPILFHIFDNSDFVKRSVLMVQKEIAHRLRAKERTKEYGILTLGLQLHGKIGKLHDVPPSCFVPPPKVTSSFFAVDYFNEDEGEVQSNIRKDVHKLIRSAFQQRRKKISNSLKNYISSHSIELNDLPDNIKKYFNQRPEELSLKDYLILYNYLNSCRKP